MKKDFYIYKCLREIHRINQELLLENNQQEILLIMNTPGSLEHFMVHTDPVRTKLIFDSLISFAVNHQKKGSIEFGFKLGREDQLSFYVTEPYGQALSQSNFEEEFEAEAELLSEITDILSGLGGKIWVDKNKETGRTFWFTLEVQPPENLRTKELNNHGTMTYPDWSDKTLLIVDDVRTNLQLLENFLSPTKSRIISVDNGLKAVNAVKRDRTISFVLMDVRMPVLDGYEATRRIKRIMPWLPVVAISAYPGSAESEKWKLAGCDAYLGKPLNISELYSVMESLFQDVSAEV
ncbi:MAG TPA: response regulator [Bacteroides sp.]|nr:response regulator [Bacteroides sp.]